MTVGSLFSGIAGFEIGLMMSGLCTESDIKWQVEIDPFCQKVLEKNFPNVKRYGDIKDVGKHNLEPVELICGGSPCQPFSVAGKRKGKDDDRFLWPEMLRVIAEIRPAWVIGENVSGFVNMALDQALSDLENQGYETATFIIPACAVGAPHRRDRVWIIANSKGLNEERGEQERGVRGKPETKIRNRDSHAPDTNIGTSNTGHVTESGESAHTEPLPDNRDAQNSVGKRGRGRLENNRQILECQSPKTKDERPDWTKNWTEVASELCMLDARLPVELDGFKLTASKHRAERLKSLGNAVVPQVVAVIGQMIMQYENLNGENKP